MSEKTVKTADVESSGISRRPVRTKNAAAPNKTNAGLQELPLHLIGEDENQPRKADNPGFSSKSLTELAATIRDRGVKSPISVREHPEAKGRFIINHGSRRYRASKLADKATIPAFVDNDYNEADQVIENLHRNELTPREIADYIGRELAKGKKRGDIARDIGKSPAFVTQHATLLDLPEPISEVFNSSRARDVTVINELVTAYKKDSEAVRVWLEDDSQELTRGSVKLLREFLEEKHRNGGAGGDSDLEDTQSGQISAGKPGVEHLDARKSVKEVEPDRFKRAIIRVKHDDRPARLILNRRPPADGWAWLQYENDDHEFKADLSNVQLVALLEG